MNNDNRNYSIFYVQFIDKSAACPFVAFRNNVTFKWLRELVGYYEQTNEITFIWDSSITRKPIKWNYQTNKEALRSIAIQWQADFERMNYSYSELSDWQGFFTELGRNYGLIREFKENGII